MTLGALATISAALRSPLALKSGERTPPLGDKPPGGGYGEVLLICRGYLLSWGFVCLAAQQPASTTAHLVALLRH